MRSSSDSHLPPFLVVDIFDTATAFEELRVVTVSRPFSQGTSNGTLVAQGLITIGVSKREGRGHS